MLIHYANLTRGLLCAPNTAKVTRLQSTHLEQHEMNAVLMGMGPQFYHDLAKGNRIKLHDYSEKERTTRAQWMGVPWINYCLHRIWYKRWPVPVIHPRSSEARPVVVQHEFDRYYGELTDVTWRAIVYYRQYLGDREFELFACDCKINPCRGLVQ